MCGYSRTASCAANPMALQGMVTTPHYLASQSGLAVLRKGGTAADAAIAAAAVLSVVYPHMCGLGGDSFWLIYNAKKGELRALNASGRAGERASIEFYRKHGLNKIPARGWLAANTVPGAVSGFEAAFELSKAGMGSQLAFKELLKDAINYAKNGFAVGPSLACWLCVNTDAKGGEQRNLQRFKGFAGEFLKRDGAPYAAGEVLRQPELAKTLEILAEKGAREFYDGGIAQKICEDIEKNGGLLTLADFKSHKADWVEPISVPYREYRAYNLPPNTQGMASLEILNILNNFDLKKYGEGTADYYHLLTEATKLAFKDRDRYLTDPAFAEIPLKELLSAGHGKAQAAQISMEKARADNKPMDPGGDTVWLGAYDRAGNAVSLIQSIYHDFGSGVIAGDTGVLLQNRGSYFSLDEEHINCLMPGKRTFHTLNSAMLFKDGKPFLIYGTMGGEGQPQTQAAIVTRIIDFGMNPQEAVDAPRFLFGRTWGDDANDLKLEGRILQEAARELARRGHTVKMADDFTDITGHAGAILVHQDTGVLQGAADPRGCGLAAAW